MSNITGVLSRKPVAVRGAGFVVPFLVLTLLGSLILLPVRGHAAEDSPEVAQLREDAQKAFLNRDYAGAAAIDLEIAGKHPGTQARHYAVQMLGTIYEENIVDIKKAVKWDKEFLEKYADSRQVPFYKEKLANLEKLMKQEQAFKTYQSILFANKGDEFMVEKFEALLKEHPDFLLKDKVESQLGYAYARMDERKKSALAFQAIAAEGEKKLSSSDTAAYETENRYWHMRTTWAWVAWAVIVMLWAAVLLMKPWKQLDRASVKKFLLWPVLWLLLAAASMPLFYSMETTGYPIQIPVTTVFTAVGLNLIFLFWLLLLIKGRFWQTRPWALRVLSPVLALLMTTGVFYLFVVYHPDGPYIVDQCTVKYAYWRGELHEWEVGHRTHEQSAVEQGRGSAVNTRDE
jgi:hypothetical protein